MRVELREMTEHPTWASDHPVKAGFGGGWGFTLKKIEKELGLLHAYQVVVEITGPRIEIRRDGWMSARSILSHPVIVSFETPELGHLQYRSGKYDVWHSNVHAVALTLERLRLIEGYGCAPSGQQYTGWAALPAADPEGDIRRALKIIGSVIEQPLADLATRNDDLLKSDYKRALVRAHPDHGGDVAALEAVQQAGRVLGLHK